MQLCVDFPHIQLCTVPHNVLLLFSSWSGGGKEEGKGISLMLDVENKKHVAVDLLQDNIINISIIIHNKE